MPSADEIREDQRAVWDGLSAGWEKWDELITRQLEPISAAMIDSLQLIPRAHHLDIASGTGEPGLRIARLASEGIVTLTDLSPQMLAVAARRAQAQGITNVKTRVCSADALPFEDGEFDSVSVRLGYMFFPDAARVTAEIVRVLKKGGRVCSAVWVRPEQNPWTSIVMRAIAGEVPLPPPEPDRPSMFRCAAPGQIGALHSAAGLDDVREWDVEVDLVTTSPQEYWDMMSEHVSLAVAALKQVDDAARERIRAAVVARAREFDRGAELHVPGMARCIAGTKQATH
jgi:ubiquinone/menaquinone biosynthesis C-methylase UbiE